MKYTPKQKTIAFDLDDVICTRHEGVEHLGLDKYNHCIPNGYYINLINNLYYNNNIVIYTARGMTSLGGDVSLIYEKLYDLTKNQLRVWGVRYHKLIMGKIHYDILIDDKAINAYEPNLLEGILDILNP